MQDSPFNLDVLTDDSGYTLTERDFEFLKLPAESVDSCLAQQIPLGMPPGMFADFKMSLLQALWRQGIRNADIRLQGSSSKFFSGIHKEMPASATDVAEAYMREFGEDLDHYQLEKITTAIRTQWPSERPLRRPFDSMFLLGLASQASDFDIQISSDEAYAIIGDSIEFSGRTSRSVQKDNPKYGFMRKELSDKEFLYLQDWVSTWEPRVKRPINIAIFSDRGPKKSKPGKMTSHFQESDWKLHQGEILRAHVVPDLIGATASTAGEIDGNAEDGPQE